MLDLPLSFSFLSLSSSSGFSLPVGNLFGTTLWPWVSFNFDRDRQMHKPKSQLILKLKICTSQKVLMWCLLWPDLTWPWGKSTYQTRHPNWLVACTVLYFWSTGLINYKYDNNNSAKGLHIVTQTPRFLAEFWLPLTVRKKTSSMAKESAAMIFYKFHFSFKWSAASNIKIATFKK